MMSRVSSYTASRLRLIILLIAIGILGIITGGCSQNQPPIISLYPTPEPIPTQEQIEIDPLATVTFQVEIPVNTPPGQPILLSLLDEVTGLGLNITREEMRQVGDSTFSITLPFPVGANIKYRYARQDTFIAASLFCNGVQRVLGC